MCDKSEGMEDTVASRRWSTPNEPSDLFGASLSNNAKSEHLLTLQVFMYVLWLLFFFKWEYLCQNVFVSVCVCIYIGFLCFFFGSLVWLCFSIPFCLGLIYLIVLLLNYYSLDVCLFSNQRQKGCESRQEKRQAAIGGVGVGEVVITIYYIKIYFQ